MVKEAAAVFSGMIVFREAALTAITAIFLVKVPEMPKEKALSVSFFPYFESVNRGKASWKMRN